MAGGAKMLEIEDMEEGLLVWWRADRAFGSSWSVPCVVTHLDTDKGSFRVRSLDDFKETGYLRLHDAVDETSRREMRVCTLDDVREFFKRRQYASEDRLIKLRRELKDYEERVSDYKNKVDAFLSSHA